VVAIARQRGGFLDTYYAYIDLVQAQRFIGTPGHVSGIEIEVDSFDHAIGVSSELRTKFEYPYSVRSWQDMFGSFLAALRLEKLGLFIVLGIIVLVAAFNIGTTLIMVVMEKHKDIAILRSMGATSRSILKIFVFEGLLIGVSGTYWAPRLACCWHSMRTPLLVGLSKRWALPFLIKRCMVWNIFHLKW
jgi:lipoprotein-releasing system permease protein